MEHRLDGCAELEPALDEREKIVLVVIIHDRQADEVPELAPVLEVVHHHDVAMAIGIQTCDEVAADESRAAGDDDHDRDPPPAANPRSAVITLVLEQPATRGKVMTRPPPSVTQP